MNWPHACIAHPCTEPRDTGSGFCKAHRKEHSESAWVIAWNKWQAEVKRVGDYRKVPWVSP